MAIPVVDNFELSFPKPLDTRFVVPNEAFRISTNFNKYVGLRVYQLDNGKTYLYTNNNEWLEERNITNVTNVTNIEGESDGNGIYGGSGSLKADTRVFFGTVSGTTNNRSNYFFYESGSIQSEDRSALYSYFYRTSGNTTFNTMAYRIEQNFTPFNSTSQQGGFLDFNSSLSPKGISIGSGGPTNNRLIKLTIDKDYISMYSNSAYPPMSFHSNTDATKSIFGFNTSLETASFNAVDEAIPTYRMKFGSNNTPTNYLWDFDIRTGESVDGDVSSKFYTAIQINATTDAIAIPQSPVKLFVDTSSRDWDKNTGVSYVLTTPQDIVRKIEHRYEKIQMWNKGTVAQWQSDILYINTEGNSFEYTMSANQQIKDIQAYKTSSFKLAFPVGTIITIKFKNADNRGPGTLKIWDGLNDSKIFCNINDATFEGSDRSKLTISYDTFVPDSGDIITFRRFTTSDSKTDRWEIIGISREKRIVERKWTTDITDWAFANPVRYLTSTSSLGAFKDWGGSVVYNNGQNSFYPAPNKFAVPPTFTGKVGPPREQINSDGFKFRFSVDGNRLVVVQGNFKIEIKEDARSTTFGNSFAKVKFLTYDEYKTNIWSIGKIFSQKYLPEYETVWTPIMIYATAEYPSGTVRAPFKTFDPILSISRMGEMFLQFDADVYIDPNLGAGMKNVHLDVYVPPFTYTAATGSYPVAGIFT